MLYGRFSLVIYFNKVAYICQSQSLNSSHPYPCPRLLSVKFVLYISVSISAFQISSSVLFFLIPHIWTILHINNLIFVLLFLTLLCMTVSRSIHDRPYILLDLETQ